MDEFWIAIGLGVVAWVIIGVLWLIGVDLTSLGEASCQGYGGATVDPCTPE